jgi:hypothetical protein
VLNLRLRLEQFRNGAQVLHRMNTKRVVPQLGDSLGYVDACLQDFLVTGNSESFDSGLEVLLAAKHNFELKRIGAWLMTHGTPKGLPKYYLAPEIIDNLYESGTAREIRLMACYARLLEGSSAHAAKREELVKDAVACMERFGDPAGRIGVAAAGFYCASLFAEDGRYAVAVGPNAVEMANDLYRRVPTRLIAAAVAGVRRDLQNRAAGIYVIDGNAITGPLTVNDAVSLLPLALKPH